MAKEAKTSSKEVKKKKQERGVASAEARKGWRIDLVRESLVDKALEENGLDRKGTIAEKVERLDAHYRNVYPADRRLDCEFDPEKGSGCGFTAPDTSKACPFCGSEDEIQDEAEVELRKTNRAGGAPAASAEKPVVEKPAEKSTAIAPAPETAPVAAEVVEEQPADDAKLRDLDAAVARVVEVHAQGVANYWDLGKALLPIFERQLYLQRRNDDGSSRYRGWTQFLAGEFGGQIAAGHSYRVMDVAKKFDRETAVKIGVAKLAILVRAKPEALPRLLKAAETTSVKELHASAVEQKALFEPGQRDTGRDERDASGKGKSAGSSEGRKAAVANAAKRAEARADNAITVATQLGTVEIPLFAKGSKEKVAKKLADDPHGEEAHVNGVVSRYEIVIGADGGLKLRIVRRRVKS